MRFIVLIACLFCGCATTPDTKHASPFCDQLSVFAASVPSGEERTVKLTRGGRWLVDHYKACSRQDEEASITFCDWLFEHTSTEFMEANINVALSCLQGQKIVGYVGNTGIELWTGKARFYYPHIDTDNVEIEIEYNVSYFEHDADEDYLQITVYAE